MQSQQRDSHSCHIRCSDGWSEFSLHGRSRAAHPSQPERAIELLVVLRRKIDEEVYVFAAESGLKRPALAAAILNHEPDGVY
jgi:hypothetical protein